jgi:hypothetical protein
MLLETWLLIIRTNMPTPLEERYPHLFDPKVWGAQARRGGGSSQQEQARPSASLRSESSAAAVSGSLSERKKDL